MVSITCGGGGATVPDQQANALDVVGQLAVLLRRQGVSAFKAKAVRRALRKAVESMPDGDTRRLLQADLGRYSKLLLQQLSLPLPFEAATGVDRPPARKRQRREGDLTLASAAGYHQRVTDTAAAAAQLRVSDAVPLLQARLPPHAVLLQSVVGTGTGGGTEELDAAADRVPSLLAASCALAVGPAFHSAPPSLLALRPAAAAVRAALASAATRGSDTALAALQPVAAQLVAAAAVQAAAEGAAGTADSGSWELRLARGMDTIREGHAAWVAAELMLLRAELALLQAARSAAHDAVERCSASATRDARLLISRRWPLLLPRLVASGVEHADDLPVAVAGSAAVLWEALAGAVLAVARDADAGSDVAANSLHLLLLHRRLADMQALRGAALRAASTLTAGEALLLPPAMPAWLQRQPLHDGIAAAVEAASGGPSALARHLLHDAPAALLQQLAGRWAERDVGGIAQPDGHLAGSTHETVGLLEGGGDELAGDGLYFFSREGDTSAFGGAWEGQCTDGDDDDNDAGEDGGCNDGEDAGGAGRGVELAALPGGGGGCVAGASGGSEGDESDDSSQQL